MKLNRSVPLGADETPASFVSRLAANHGLAARELCLDFGLSFQGVVDGRNEALEKLGDLGGVSLAALAADAFVLSQHRQYVHRGEILTREQMRRSRIRVCPACIKTDLAATPTNVLPEAAASNRAIWLIESVRTCPTHSLALIEITDDLDAEALHDFAFHMARALPRVDNLASAAVSRAPSVFERYVLDRLDGLRRGGFLDGFPLHAAIRICEMIGAVAVYGRTPNLKRLTDDEWWSAGSAGFQIAAGGPGSVQSFLAELQRTYPLSRSATEGPQALFGRLYQWLAFGAEDAAYDGLRGLMAEYTHAHLPLGPGDVVFGRPVTARILHSVRTLSTETGLHPKRLRKLLRAAGVLGDDQDALVHGNAIFPAQAASEVVRTAAGALSLPEAGRHLNAPRVHIDLLTRKGFIKPHVAAREFSAADKYAVADLDDFLSRLFERAVAVRKPKADQLSIPAAAKRACCSAADILHLVLGGKLKWIGKLTSQRGYLAVLVSSDEVRAKTRGHDAGGLTRRPAAKRLRTTEPVVEKLIEKRHLKTFVARDPVNRCPQVLISHQEIDRFCRDYVSLFVLAEERGKHFKRVLNELNAEGVEPAFKPATIGARFYSRSDVSLDKD